MPFNREREKNFTFKFFPLVLERGADLIVVNGLNILEIKGDKCYYFVHCLWTILQLNLIPRRCGS